MEKWNVSRRVRAGVGHEAFITDSREEAFTPITPNSEESNCIIETLGITATT